MAQRNSQQLKMAATNSNPSRWDRGFLKTCSAPWVSSGHSFPWPADEHKKPWKRKPWVYGHVMRDSYRISYEKMWKNDICLKKGYGGIYGDISPTGIKFIKVRPRACESQVMTDFKGPILVAKLCSRWWIDRKSGCGRRMNMYKSKKQMKHGIRYVGCARRWFSNVAMWVLWKIQVEVSEDEGCVQKWMAWAQTIWPSMAIVRT